MYFIVDLVHGAADLLQSAAGIIADLIFVNDTSAYLGADQCQRLNLLEKYIQTIFRIVYSLMTAVGLDLPCIFQKLADAQEFPASKSCTDFQTL